MKKAIYLLMAACAVLLSCTKNDTKTPGETNTPVIEFSYSLSGPAKTDLTMILTVDGKDYRFAKDSDKQTIKLTSSSGTVKFDCTVDESKTYTEKQDLTFSVQISAASIASDGTSYSALHSILTHSVALKGLKADKVTETLVANASVMNFSKTYAVDSNGIISIK